MLLDSTANERANVRKESRGRTTRMTKAQLAEAGVLMIFL